MDLTIAAHSPPSDPLLSNTTSEEEFWSGLDQVSAIQGPELGTAGEGHGAKDREKTLVGRKPAGSAQEDKTDSLESSRLEKSLHILRAAKRVEVQNAVLVARNKVKVTYTQREMESVLTALRTEYESGLRDMQDNYADVKTILYRKDKEIERYSRMVYDQEMMLTALRLGVSSHLPRRYVKSTEAAENDELRSEVKRLTSQLESLKSLCRLYQDEADVAKSELKETKAVLRTQGVDFEKITKSMEVVASGREKVLIEERDVTIKIFEEYKEEVEKELHLREILSERQNKYIQTLQNELKSAKIIIKSPRLRTKMLARLKDLETPVDFEDLSVMSKTTATPKAKETQSKTPKRQSGGQFRFPKDFPDLHQQFRSSRDSSPISPADPQRGGLKGSPLLPYLSSPIAAEGHFKVFS